MTIANELPDVVDPEGRYRSAFSYHPFDVEIAKADGIYLIDTKGRKYIDASGGPMAVNIGHGHPRMKRAIAEQMEAMPMSIRPSPTPNGRNSAMRSRRSRRARSIRYT